MRRFSLFLIAILLIAPAGARAEPPLTVVSWGGAYELAQRHAVFEPFTEETGIAIEVLQYNGGLDALRARAEAESWDVIDMTEGQAIAACEDGLIQPLEAARIVAPGPEGSAEADFMPGAFRRCSITHIVFATVIGYDERAFPGVKPTRVEDFFDLEAFPGKRAIEKSPDVILEWALMAEGVPASQVYDLLSTARGLDLAFRKLEEIREAIVWWEEAGAPARMLRDGEVAMASGYNGRFFSAAWDEGAPVNVVWDGRIIGYDVWAIAADTDRPEAARRFLRHATAPAPLASLAEYIPYGPARRSAMNRIGLNPNSRIPMRDHLPNAPQHGRRALIRDSAWYAHTQDLRQRRFEAWLARE